MPFITLTPQILQRVRALHRAASTHLHAGHASLASAYRGAADALRRGDDITAEHWLEKADLERYLLKASA